MLVSSIVKLRCLSSAAMDERAGRSVKINKKSSIHFANLAGSCDFVLVVVVGDVFRRAWSSRSIRRAETFSLRSFVKNQDEKWRRKQ